MRNTCASILGSGKPIQGITFLCIIFRIIMYEGDLGPGGGDFGQVVEFGSEDCCTHAETIAWDCRD